VPLLLPLVFFCCSEDFRFSAGLPTMSVASGLNSIGHFVSHFLLGYGEENDIFKFDKIAGERMMANWRGSPEFVASALPNSSWMPHYFWQF
jgi:hypothetical protein